MQTDTDKYFDQQHVVDQTEDLQDFRRRQEGHLIIADGGRPLLVMSFGTKYDAASGQVPAKYKIEGRYDIPVGYKVIIKWHEDEIVFMTRQGTYGPEFQIVYLPKSPSQDDFTLFEWNPSIAEIWQQFLIVLQGKEDNDDKDHSIFHQGPWRTFGVTRDEVQIALQQGTDHKRNIPGKLYCAPPGDQPSLEEHATYLGFDHSNDDNYLWICAAFKDEPLPNHIYQYVRDGEVYFVDGRTQDSTWKHPHYDKYKRMLQTARVQKPLPFWQDIMAFRIEFLLTSLYAPPDGDAPPDVTGEYPLVETVENVHEMARIFRVEIKNEPFLVHVLRRSLRHYGNAVREKRKVRDVADFRNLMQRYRDIVEQFERSRDVEARKIKRMKVCVQCDQKDAVIFCNQCRDFFCQGCFDRLHSRGRRQKHGRTWVEMGMCAECQESSALFYCVHCADPYCRDCFQEWHVRGGRRNHVPIVLRSFNSQAGVLPEAGPAMGTESQKILAQARSYWFRFIDENGINLYYNLWDETTRRDMPLAVINEPIEESVGGGFSGGWAGTWGANMFDDDEGGGQTRAPARMDSTI